jgi:hypothetical protein
MMAKVRSRLPCPPTQASALSANPSRCSAPVMKTHTANSRAACSIELLSRIAQASASSTHQRIVEQGLADFAFVRRFRQVYGQPRRELQGNEEWA